MSKGKEPNILTSIISIIFFLIVIGVSIHNLSHYFIKNTDTNIVGNTYVNSEGGKDYLKIKSKSTLSIVSYDLGTGQNTWNDISYTRSGNRLSLNSDDLHNAFPNLESNVTEYIQLSDNAKEATKVDKDDSGALKVHLKLKQ